MKKYNVGLIVGKFSPLHAGHEFLINTALSNVDKLYVISWSKPSYYKPELINSWLTTLFPTATCIVLTDPNMPHNDDSPESQRKFIADYWKLNITDKLDVIFSSEDYGDPFAVSMSENLGHSVVSVKVDVNRNTYPVSGTAIRNASNLLNYKKFISPPVYTDLIQKVLFLGGESTGKSTIVKYLNNKYGYNYVEEYGREHWDLKNGQLEFNDMEIIAKTQLSREYNESLNTPVALMCDTSVITTAMYSNYMFNSVDPWLTETALTHIKKYNYIFLCDTEIPLYQDGTRMSDSNFRLKQNTDYINFLNKNNIEYILLSGSLDDRALKVHNIISKNTIK